jgi:hypothetical protein
MLFSEAGRQSRRVDRLIHRTIKFYDTGVKKYVLI